MAFIGTGSGHQPMEVGNYVDLDLVGIFEEGKPYGFLNGNRVIIGEFGRRNVEMEGGAAIGDSVLVRIDYFNREKSHATATVMENRGSFVRSYIESEEPVEVRITGRSMDSALDIMSSPNVHEDKCGFRESLLIGENMKYRKGKIKEVVVTGSDVRSGRLRIFARPAHGYDARDPEKDIFISSWKGKKDQLIRDISSIKYIPSERLKSILLVTDVYSDFIGASILSDKYIEQFYGSVADAVKKYVLNSRSDDFKHVITTTEDMDAGKIYGEIRRHLRFLNVEYLKL